MKKLKTRESYIFREIRSWMILNEKSMKSIADDFGKHPSTIANFVRGLTNTAEIKSYFINQMGYSIWDKYPPMEYIVTLQNNKS